MKMKIKHRYNWKPDLPDFRDCALALGAPGKPPAKVDLRPHCSPVVNQGKIGSCTGSALAGAFEFLELKELKIKGAAAVFAEDFAPVSRLFIYYNERLLEGTVDHDGGARLRDGVKALTKFGACREETWNYKSSLVLKKPSAKAYKEATGHRITEYLKIGSLPQIKSCLAEGFPVAFGFTVYESFESITLAKTGKMPLPRLGEKILGGHAVLAVGYDDATDSLLVRNSWGPTWGMDGYFLMPYDYIERLRLGQDFWTIRG